MKKLPIGVQSIVEILKEKQMYIDKTAYALDLIRDGKHYFISRPRRFGKSLFINTLEEIFKGNKDLFEGLEIYKSDYNWESFPVLRFDFSQITNSSSIEFKESLQRSFIERASSHDIQIDAPNVKEGLKSLITKLANKTKKKIVVLVDEYDDAIINRLKNLDVALENKEILKDFFTVLKSLDEHLKFTFVTGVSKFSQVSLFSGPNNLNDITMNPRYAGLMGYTEDELRSNFKSYIHDLAQESSLNSKKVSDEDIICEIRTWYNGYRFSEGEVCVYNPFSTLKFMQNKKPKPYWYSSGTPSFLIEELKSRSDAMVSLDGSSAIEEELMDISCLDNIDITALMYQTGYLTIQSFNPVSKRYRLGLPNEEVRSAFINSLVQNFAKIPKLKASKEYVDALEDQRPEVIFKQVEVGFASFAYHLFVDAKERTYQGMLLAMLYGMGFDPMAERATNIGRIDVALELQKTVYILELKLDGDASRALQQIHDKKYYLPFTQKGKKIVIVGANFSSDTRNISQWKGEVLSEKGTLEKEIFPTN